MMGRHITNYHSRWAEKDTIITHDGQTKDPIIIYDGLTKSRLKLLMGRQIPKYNS